MNYDNNKSYYDLYESEKPEEHLNSIIYNTSYSNNSSSSNENENSEQNRKRKNRKKLKSRFFICNNICKKGLNFEFNECNMVECECDCRLIKDCTVDNFIKRNTIRHKDELEPYCKCLKHNKKFIEYCINCSSDICEDCLEEKKTYINFNEELKYHEDHKRIKLEDVDDILDEIKKLLRKIKKEELPEGDIGNRRIFNIILNLVKKYKYYPCYNLYKSLSNSRNYLLNFHFPKMKTMLKITSIEDLKKNIKNSDLIKTIKINYKKFSDISIFKEMKLKFLEELELIGNGIKDITPLKYCNFENLKILHLSDNKLNNECINILKNIRIPNLELLNLFRNKITTTEVFGILKEKYFPKLNTFYIGENKFDKKEIAKNKTYYFPPKIKIFGFTGIVSSENIDFIYKLKIEKLKNFFISRSLLSSISFIKKINFENLEEFIANFNQLTNLNELSYFNDKTKQTLKKIYLKGNKISNFDKIENIIKDFKNLKEINLEDNPIDFNKYKELIERIENERGIKIVYKSEKKM